MNANAPSMGFLLTLLLLYSLVGCGGGSDTPPLGSVTGVVSMDGKPLENVMVYFEPETGRTSSGMTDATGRYELQYTRDNKGAKVGPHTVRITRQEEMGLMLGEFGEGGQPNKDEAEKPLPIPEKYNTKSTLKADVQEGSNTFDFTLEAEAAKK